MRQIAERLMFAGAIVSLGALWVLGEPAKNPSWWINRARFESLYVRRGDVWLPAKNASSSHVRIGGEATLTIEYGTYPVVMERALKPTVASAENGTSAIALGR